SRAAARSFKTVLSRDVGASVHRDPASATGAARYPALATMRRHPRMRFQLRACPLGALLLALLPALEAQAHVGQGDTASGFSADFLLPLRGFDPLLAMLAVGMWGAQLGTPALWVLPVAFPLVMALGGVAGILAVPLPGSEVAIVLSVVLLGSAIALGGRPPVWI